ncbi:SDR family oxidoreductase [Streptomyces durbertensis]|uniref:SDR family oxidoreductase n=1 Tax=Streptomyces durbertensis TaxID=2448886 RepID=A0ABR6EER3_9ACTN|nr:SDR family oxidoreductase [Streptomyces durbertensis]MBB1243817.1 SDR family oxidoreductase [Streptomyces durbertensis]
MSIVVTGATGKLGRLVVEGLLDVVPAAEVAAVVRDAGKAADLAARGVEIRVADYDRPETLADAFRAGDRVLLVSGNEVGRRLPQHRAVIDAAKAAGVAQLAYTSILGAETAEFRLAAEHQETERLIVESGVPHTLLRNGWYTENYTENLAPVLEHGAVVGNSGAGRIASATRADYAAAAVAVLTTDGHLGAAYELNGDADWSLAEYAPLVAELSGRPVAHADVPADEHLRILLGAGLPAAFAAILVDVDDHVARGALAARGKDLSRLIGRPTTPLRDSVAEALRGLGA